ncbi:hypothetical protein F5Y12DRAFT_610390 [Xylaria sp. FL1777]|nr:hypothetical protein F5Y12DRAFT_610390 [Xylaria sp. FL1777]
MVAPISPAHSFRLSPLEGFMPRTYVRQIFCFPTTDPQAVNTLVRGLSGVARDVPYILSRVVSNKSGVVVCVSTPLQNPEDIFSCHSLSDSIDYATLKAGHFAPGAFLAHGIIPPETVPPYTASSPVFVARASLINGGLILCVAVHHAVTDITGYDALLKIWAAHCRDGSSRTVEFNASWIDRGPLFSAPERPPSGASMPDLLHTRTPEEPVRGAGRLHAAGQKNYQTGIFYFPQRHLRVLKAAVNEHVTSREPGSWISTSDILSSLLWNAIIGAQQHPLPLDTDLMTSQKNARISTLSFPVQFRSALRQPLPRNFLGAAFLMTSARVPHKDVCLISPFLSINSTSTAQGQESKHEPQVDAEAEVLINSVDISALAQVALAIRRSIQRIDDAAVRGVLAYLEAHPDTDPEAPLVLGPPRCEAGGSGTSVVSWADQCVYELNWGDAIGRCDAVRLPKMAYKRDPIVLPHIPSLNRDDGGVEDYEVDVMQRLIESLVMRRFAALRCLS